MTRRVGKVARRRGREDRGAARRDRRRVEAAAARLGESLLGVRDSEAWRAAEFDSFADWARAHVLNSAPQRKWKLSPPQADELVRTGIELAERKRHRIRQSVEGERAGES